jgi:hypothetical protein
VSLSRIPAIRFGITLKICATKKRNPIRFLSIDGQYRRAFAGAWLVNARQLWMTGWGACEASNDALFRVAGELADNGVSLGSDRKIFSPCTRSAGAPFDAEGERDGLERTDQRG